MEEISDGRLYGPNDMVKADCLGCNGCSSCCRGMGSSVILDPYDVYRMTTGLHRTMQELMSGELEWNVVDGVILPNLNMNGPGEKCPFLSDQGRCRIHAYRPGICRLFPLGRYYENGSFRYFLQTGECDHARAKVKVSKWIDTPNVARYSAFVTTWHYLCKEVEELIAGETDPEFQKNLNLFVMNTFYMAPYDGERDFYEQFDERITRFRQIVPE